MNFLKKTLLKSGLFIEDNAQKETNEPVTEPVRRNAPQVNNLPPTANITGAILSESDVEKFEKYFSDLFDKSNLPGPDYYEFWKMMESLEEDVPDETKRMKAAFKALSVQGITKGKILETANTYLQMVAEDKVKFDSAVSEKETQALKARKSQIEANHILIAENRKKIADLMKQSEDATKENSKLENEIAEEAQKIERNKSGYDLASRAMSDKISSDIYLIQNNL